MRPAVEMLLAARQMETGGTKPWDVSTASYVQSFSVAAQETVPTGVHFKPDGTKMYVLGLTGDDVNEYNLLFAWNISTASYLQSFSVAAQDRSPYSVAFKPDGAKMYVLGGLNKRVYEYDLSSAWGVSTASYLQNFSVAAQDTQPRGMYFKSDGTKMYLIGAGEDRVYEYNLSSAWDVSTTSYVQSFSVAAQETVPNTLYFKSDGTKMYVLGVVGDDVNEYNLSSAWDVSTASYLQSFRVAAQDTNPTGLFFKPDGTIMYIIGSTNDAVNQYAIG